MTNSLDTMLARARATPLDALQAAAAARGARIIGAPPQDMKAPLAALDAFERTNAGKDWELPGDSALLAEAAKAGVSPEAITRSLDGVSRGDLLETRNFVNRIANGVADRATKEGRDLNAREATVLRGCARMNGAVAAKLAIVDGGYNSGEASGWHNPETGAPVRIVGREHVGKMRAALGITDNAEISVGDFIRGVAGMKTTESVRNALSVGTDGSGGFAVPSVIFADFVDALVPASSVLQAGARIVPLAGAAKSFRFARIATVPTAAWRSEAGAVAESDPAFTALDLTPQSLAFKFLVSRELLADSGNIDAMLLRAIVAAFAKAIDSAALRGSGTPPEIRGLANISGIGSITNGAAGTALGTIKWSNLLSSYQTILDANGPVPTAAIMAPRTLVGFDGLADSTGQPLQRPTLLQAMNFIATSAVPVNETVGASTDCSSAYVGDFREFLIGMREDVSIVRTDHLHAGTGQVGFYCHTRVDVGVLHAATFARCSGIRP